MKKITIAFFVGVFMFCVATPVSHAQSTSIASLQALIVELTQKLAALKNSPPNSTVSNSPISNNTIIDNSLLWVKIRKAPLKLKVGEQGEWQVRILRLDPAAPYNMQTTWGEAQTWEVMKLPAPPKANQLVVLKHAFSKPGTYHVQFAAAQGSRTDIRKATVVVTE